MGGDVGSEGCQLRKCIYFVRVLAVLQDSPWYLRPTSQYPNSGHAEKIGDADPSCRNLQLPSPVKMRLI